MEIERKWIVTGWPTGLPLLYEHTMEQGYLTVRPTVRIRKEARTGGETKYILCLKSGSGIVRREVETELTKEQYDEVGRMIDRPLIPKVRRTYRLPDGFALEVNHVDEGAPTEFWYAEIEYPTVADARCWEASDVGLQEYLREDVSEQPGQSMGEYWELTRLSR